MTPVSRKRLDIKNEIFLDDAFKQTFTKQVSPKDSIKLLEVLLTRTELEMIRKRIGIILLLSEGLDIDNISKFTKTTRQTVARIRLQLLEVSPENKDYLNKILKSIKTSHNIEDMIKEIQNIDISRSNFRKKVSSL